MTIVKVGDGLGAGDRRPPGRCPNDLGDGRHGEIFSAAGFISFFDDLRVRVLECFSRIDLRPVFAVRDQSVPVRMHARGQSRAVHIGRGGINGMMPAEGDALACELPEHRCVLLVDEVGTHPIPDHQNDVAVLSW